VGKDVPDDAAAWRCPDTPESLCDGTGALVPCASVAHFGLSAGSELPESVRRFLDGAAIPYRTIAVNSSGYFTFFGPAHVAVGEAAVLDALRRDYGAPTERAPGRSGPQGPC
jgi:hypothetical protein